MSLRDPGVWLAGTYICFTRPPRLAVVATSLHEGRCPARSNEVLQGGSSLAHVDTWAWKHQMPQKRPMSLRCRQPVYWKEACSHPRNCSLEAPFVLADHSHGGTGGCLRYRRLAGTPRKGATALGETRKDARKKSEKRTSSEGTPSCVPGILDEGTYRYTYLYKPNYLGNGDTRQVKK